MNVTNISEAKGWFEVLQTGERSQTAMMTLAPGDATGDKAETHEKSDQVLLILGGELTGEVGDQRPHLERRRDHYSCGRETPVCESSQEAGGNF